MKAKRLTSIERDALLTLDAGGNIILGHSPILYDRDADTVQALPPKVLASLRANGYVVAPLVPTGSMFIRYVITDAGRDA